MQNNESLLPGIAERHAAFERQRWHCLKQQLTGEDDRKPLSQLLAQLDVPCDDADLAAWEPEALGDVHFSAQNGYVVDDGETDTLFAKLNGQQVQRLRESVAALPDGISQEEVISAMLDACEQDYPELFEQLQSFFQK